MFRGRGRISFFSCLVFVTNGEPNWPLKASPLLRFAKKLRTTTAFPTLFLVAAILVLHAIGSALRSVHCQSLHLYSVALLDLLGMRILVLSDLHANATALKAALAAAQGRWERIVCLGDVVGLRPRSNEVTSKIRELGAQNHSRKSRQSGHWIDAHGRFSIPLRKRQSTGRARSSLPTNLKWLVELPHGPLEVGGIVLVHGALQDEDEYVFTPEQALEGLLDSNAGLTFFGHTHHQGGFSYANAGNHLEC